MFRTILFFLIIPLWVWGTPVSITLEHALTWDQRMWGLMGRPELPPNHGMLFHLPGNGKETNFWMFNCLFDLSVAFIDSNNIILNIFDLKSYPNKMDPKRPVKSLKDLSLYPPNDPVVLFFREKAVKGPYSAKYALEMKKNWFQEHGIKPGDMLFWNKEKGTLIPSPNTKSKE